MSGCPDFLVLLCTHDGERYLSDQLDSLARQTLRPRKIVIHDWASGDGTRQVISSFVQRLGGEIDVRFVGHAVAPGARASFASALMDSLATEQFDFLLLCDQDDIWLPDKIRILAESFDQTGFPDICFSDAIIVDEHAASLRKSYYDEASPFLPPVDVAHPSVLFANPAIGMTMCLRRRFLERARPSLEAPWMMHDWGLLLFGVATGSAVRFLPQPLVKYRQHRANALGASTRGRLLDRTRKARMHVARLRSQVEILREAVDWRGSPCSVILGNRGFPQRWAAVSAILTCPFLKRTERFQLAAAVALCW